MDNIKIKDYIINNFKDDDCEGIKKAIIASIEEQDEVTLPGMGVFFELLWENSTDEDRKKILTILKNSFQKNNN